MKAGVVVFPGSNCDHDTYHALKHVLGQEARFVWHKDSDLRGLDAVVLPGGFAYGDYLRTGAIARFSPVMRAVTEFAGGGGTVLNLSLPSDGGTASFTFGTAGSFAYKCPIHPSIMFGDSVIVDAAASTTDTTVTVVGIATPGFNPRTVRIKTGGTVHWTNNTGIDHGVINQ